MEARPQPAAVTDRVLEEHRELKALLTTIAAFCEEPRPEIGLEEAHHWATALSGHLLQLHDRLFRHYRHESEGGMFEELLRRHPRALKRIEILQGEHGLFLDEIRQLNQAALGYSQGEELPDPRLRTRLKALLDLMDRHEEREHDLITRLHLRDIGDVD